MHVGVDYKGALNKKWLNVEFEKITYWRESWGSSRHLVPVQKVAQFFSFTGQICFRSDVNTNYLYLLIFSTDVATPPFVIVRWWEQWRQSNDKTRATAPASANQWHLLLFLQLDWKLQNYCKEHGELVLQFAICDVRCVGVECLI